MATDEIHCHACAATYGRSANFCPECGAENEAFEASGGKKREPAAVEDDQLPGDDRAAAARYDRVVDREWSLASADQALAGLKAGVYATVAGFVATVAVTGLTVGLRVATGDGPDVGGIDAGNVLADQAVDAVVALFDAGGIPVEAALKGLAWLFYAAAFVPVTVAAEGRRVTVDFLSALAPLGVLPVLLHAAVIAVFVVFGYRAAGSRGYRSVPETIAAGGTVAVGVLALAVPGLLLASLAVGPLTVGPGPTPTAVATLGGLSAACGLVGSGIRVAVRRRS